MKTIRSMLLLLLIATWAYGADETTLTNGDKYIIKPYEHVPLCKITFRGGNDKEGILDFCGDKITYTGELPADEAAKMFFEGILKQHIQCVGRNSERK